MQTLFEGKLAKFRICSNGRAVILIDPPARAQTHVEAKTHGPALTLKQIEKNHIKMVLSQGLTLADCASTLGINLSTLWRKRKEYGL